MKSLEQMTAPEALALEGLLFDLDDTLLCDGQLSLEAYQALFLLRDSGLRLIALTGRPASWADVIARQWPVEAAIAENGALAFKRSAAGVQRVDSLSHEARRSRSESLARLAAEAHAAFPALVAADDVTGRVTDYTFDIGEHEQASEALIAGALSFAHASGARTTRSSVHLHYTFDHADKATGALDFLQATGLDATRARRVFAFIGDSENDAPCFNTFRTTVGVANLSGTFSLAPRYRTEGRAAAGFREFASRLSQLRSARPLASPS